MEGLYNAEHRLYWEGYYDARRKTLDNAVKWLRERYGNNFDLEDEYNFRESIVELNKKTR